MPQGRCVEPRRRPDPSPRGASHGGSAHQQGEALIADIAARRKRIGDDFYEIGVSLQKLARRTMYLGYDNFNALLEDRDLLTRIQAYKLITVVEA